MAHLDSSKLTGQVQRSLLGLVDQTGVGLMLQQHLRLKANKQTKKQSHNFVCVCVCVLGGLEYELTCF